MSAAGLVIAHPGHELQLHGWLADRAPAVWILTDGSGLDGKARTHASAQLLEALAAPPGSIFGQLTERDAYAALLDGDAPLFLDLADRLTRELDERGIEDVVSDSAEGYHPVHDVCRLLVDAAVLALRRGGRAVRSFDFGIYEGPEPEAPPEGSLRIELDDARFEAKLAAAHAYREVDRMVDDFLERFGRESFRTEWLRKVEPAPAGYAFRDAVPVFERYGDWLRSQGRVERVVRAWKHLAPVADALAGWTERPITEGRP